MNKTKTMIIGTTMKRAKIQVGNEKIQKVFKYVGTWISENVKCRQEILGLLLLRSFCAESCVC